MKKEDKGSKINRFNILWVNIQVIMTVLVLILLILAFAINKKYLFPMEICMGLDLLVMAYNNHLIYRRRNTTILYIIVGIAVLIYAILGVI
jgi:hypothetical protein